MNMKRQTMLFLLFSMSIWVRISAQIFTPVIDETALQFRVKQVDEFFARFNYETDYKGDAPTDKSVETRKKNLLTLFNLDAFTLADKSYSTELTALVDSIIKNNTKIHYEDSTWHAEAISSLTYDGKKYDATFFLRTERKKGVMFRWAIFGIESSMFKQFPAEPKDSISISPADHGLAFMTVPQTLNLNRTAIGTAFTRDYKRNNLNVLDFLLSAGKVVVGPVTKAKFYFDLPYGSFMLERIEKEEGYNQGWLINKINLKSNDEKEK